jgi:hypothetical protein
MGQKAAYQSSDSGGRTVGEFFGARAQFVVAETEFDDFTVAVVGKPALQQSMVDLRMELQGQRTA